MDIDIRRLFNKKIMLLLFVIILGFILIYLGIFCIYYTRDTITSYSSNDTEDVEYWDVDWVTDRPYVGLGWWLFIIGLVLLSTGIIGVMICRRQTEK